MYRRKIIEILQYVGELKLGYLQTCWKALTSIVNNIRVVIITPLVTNHQLLSSY